MSLARCKACGHIMDESKVRDVCPACGLPNKVFEPYRSLVSEKRRFILDQHIHPIAVHFPQVLLVFALFLPLLASIVSEPIKTELNIITKWSILMLPWFLIISALTGIFDGKIRFRKLKTPLLVNKMIAGTAIQVLSLISFGVYLTGGLAGTSFWIICVCNLLSVPIAIYLGKTGSALFQAVMPG